MPVRSLTSPVLKWPDARTVEVAARRWAAKVTAERPEVLQIGYFGSYARGDWGVGSDLDVLIIVAQSDKPFEMRPSEWDTLEIPVPTDVLVYTQKEWQNLAEGSFFQNLADEVVWI
jgi:uncharacterized protein